jgi:hypothetical protein
MDGNGGYVRHDLQANVTADWTIIDTRGDYNGDGKSDLLWTRLRHNAAVGTDEFAVWEMNGGSSFSGGVSGTFAIAFDPLERFHSVNGHSDFNGDGRSDILFQQAPSGMVVTWQMNGRSFPVKQDRIGEGSLLSVISTDGDYNADRTTDILYRHQDGTVATWEMQGATYAGYTLQAGVLFDWAILAADSDYTGDGRSDILWRHTDGTVAIWEMQGGSQFLGRVLQSRVSADWQIVDAAGDYNGDGRADLLWTDASGAIATWEMGPNGAFAGRVLGIAPGRLLDGHADFNGDGKSDLLFSNSGGGVTTWQVLGGSAYISHSLPPDQPGTWTVVGAAEPGASLVRGGTMPGTLRGDFIEGGGVSNTVTGGQGRDVFAYFEANDPSRPDGGSDFITDFQVGPGGDVLDLDVLLSRNGSAAFTEGFVRFVESGADTLVQIDQSGGGDSFTTLVTLLNAVLTQEDTVNYLV